MGLFTNIEPSMFSTLSPCFFISDTLSFQTLFLHIPPTDFTFFPKALGVKESMGKERIIVPLFSTSSLPQNRFLMMTLIIGLLFHFLLLDPFLFAQSLLFFVISMRRWIYSNCDFSTSSIPRCSGCLPFRCSTGRAGPFQIFWGYSKSYFTFEHSSFV